MEKNLKRVTIEQAEKLDKLGFDYETDFAYYKDEAHVGLLTVEVIMRTSKPFYFAPTVDLALQYLEEKWGFCYEIYKGEGSDARFGFKGNNSRFSCELLLYFGFTSTGSYETRKEAKSHLLTEALDFYLEALNKEKEAKKDTLATKIEAIEKEIDSFLFRGFNKKKEAEKDTLATKIEAIEKEIDSIKKLL